MTATTVHPSSWPQARSQGLIDPATEAMVARLMARMTLEEKIGQTIPAGIDRAFGPTLAVPQDDRWGRTYEGYSEDPAVVRSYAGAMIEELQGAPGTGRIQNGHVAASAKQFLGDGGSRGGVDQGDAQVDEATLIRIHAAGYPPAIDAGAMTIMASSSSWNGQKMHGNHALLTDVLKGADGIARRPVDGPQMQEGAAEFRWAAGGRATLRIAGKPFDLRRETNADLLLQMTYRVDRAPAGAVALSLGGGVDAASLSAGAGAGTGWRTVRIPLKCFQTHGGDLSRVAEPFAPTATGPFTLALADVRLATGPAGAVCPN